MAQRLGLCKKVRAAAALDPRRDKWRGYGPEVIIGQLIYELCSGGMDLHRPPCSALVATKLI